MDMISSQNKEHNNIFIPSHFAKNYVQMASTLAKQPHHKGHNRKNILKLTVIVFISFYYCT